MKDQIGKTEIRTVYGNTDNTEGRGTSIVLGRFLRAQDAQTFAQGRGVMGTPADVRTESVPTVTVGDKVYMLGDRVFANLGEATEDARAKVREQALSKLTLTLREALVVWLATFALAAELTSRLLPGPVVDCRSRAAECGQVMSAADWQSIDQDVY